MAQESAAPSQSTLTRQAAERLERIRNTKLHDSVKQQAALCLLDYLGALVSGLSTPWASALLHYAQGQPSLEANGVHVVALKKKVSAEVAAFTNASLAHR
jgi:2-methylcitrate dehydratase PrpD